MLSVTLFVDADAPTGGNGLAWSTAFDDLQAALESASVLNGDADAGNDVDAIWIAEGVYKPSAELEPGDARSASFSLVDGVTVYGGFAGTETTLAERNLGSYETVLSGDLGVVGDTADNAYTVVYCAEDVEAAVDGVWIVDGNADGSSRSSHPERQDGGGLYSSGMLTVTNSTFSGNSAYAAGAGICIGSGTATVTNCALSGNSADFYGGGICNYGTLTVTDSTLSQNSGVYGGGIRNFRTLTVAHCTLSENSVTRYGSHSARGGGIYSGYGTLTVTNSTLVGNRADDYGGGICSSDALTVANSTLSQNLSQNGGGICSLGSSSTATLNNTIVAGNLASSGPDVYRDSGTLFGSYNLIGDGAGQSSLVDGEEGNQIGTSDSPIDPRLSDWGELDGGRVGYYLLPGSPALDTGENALAVDATGQPLVEDIYGNLRIQNGTVDIGAVEGVTVGSPGRNYVVSSLDGTIAEDGVLTFSEAFEAANRNQPVGDAQAGSFAEPDVIRFAEGLSGTISVADGELVIQGNLSIEGPGAALLAFDAGGESRVFLVKPGVSAALRGITVRGGSADEAGGIYNDHATLTVDNSTVSGNSATGRDDGGGGIANSGTLTVTNATISGNSATGSSGNGGGISNSGTLTIANSTVSGNSAKYGAGIHGSGTLTVTDSTLSGNPADEKGGAIYNDSGTVTVSDSTVSGNTADEMGGGIYNRGTLTVTNCEVSGNHGDYSSSRGGGIYNSSGTATITNSTLSGNSAGKCGGGIFSWATLTITNCTLSGNSAFEDGGGIYAYSSALTVTNSTLSGNSATWSLGSGGGICIGNSSTTRLDNTIVAGNTASSRRDIYHWSGTLTGSHNLIGNGSGQSSLVNGVDGNLVGTSQPLFIRNPSDGNDGWGDDPSTPDIDESANDDYGDLRLRPDSPAIDAGDNTLLPVDEFDLDGDGDTGEPIPVDLAGSARVEDGDTDGTATVDIGAYEYFAVVAVPGDLNGDGTVSGADLDIIRANWGQSVTPGSLSDGDPSGDGTVGGPDLDIVRANWGKTAPAASVATLGVASGEEGGTEDTAYGRARQSEGDSTWHRNLQTLADAAWDKAVAGLRTRTGPRATRAVDRVMLDWPSS